MQELLHRCKKSLVSVLGAGLASLVLIRLRQLRSVMDSPLSRILMPSGC